MFRVEHDSEVDAMDWQVRQTACTRPTKRQRGVEKYKVWIVMFLLRGRCIGRQGPGVYVGLRAKAISCEGC